MNEAKNSIFNQKIFSEIDQELKKNSNAYTERGFSQMNVKIISIE